MKKLLAVFFIASLAIGIGSISDTQSLAIDWGPDPQGIHANEIVAA